MIGRLTGKLAEVELTSVLLDVQGVGYAVSIPMSTYDKLPKCNEMVTLLIHTDVREDAIVLYGFATADERELFRHLTSVSGIGPKSALNILSCMPVSRFCQAVTAGDLKTLQCINGIGKKSAERMIVELRDKLSKWTASGQLKPQQSEASIAANDAAFALEQLGFRRETVQKVIQKLSETLPSSEQSSEQFIRKALAMLNS